MSRSPHAHSAAPFRSLYVSIMDDVLKELTAPRSQRLPRPKAAPSPHLTVLPRKLPRKKAA